MRMSGLSRFAWRLRLVRSYASLLAPRCVSPFPIAKTMFGPGRRSLRACPVMDPWERLAAPRLLKRDVPGSGRSRSIGGCSCPRSGWARCMLEHKAAGHVITVVRFTSMSPSTDVSAESGSLVEGRSQLPTGRATAAHVAIAARVRLRRLRRRRCRRCTT